MTEAGKDGGFSLKNLFKKSAASTLVGATVLTGGFGEAAKTQESFEAPKSTNQEFVKAEDTTANIVENGQVNLHIDPEKALENLKQKTNEIASDHLAAKMGANNSEKPTINWQKTDEQMMEGLEQQTNEIKTDSLTAQMGADTTSEKPTINWKKTDEQIMEGVKQETAFIATEHLADQMGNNTTQAEKDKQKLVELTRIQFHNPDMSEEEALLLARR